MNSQRAAEPNPDGDTPHPAQQPARKGRGSRVWRGVKWALLILLIVVLASVGLVAWVATTRSGLDFAWSQIGPRLPAGYEVASVEGRLIGPLEIRGVKVDTPGMFAAVKALDLDWRAGELLSARLHITNLAVRGVTYRAKKTAEPEPEKPQEPFSLPETIDLPVAVRVDRVAIDDVSAVTAPKGEPFVVDSARLRDARLDNQDWRIGSLTGHGPMFDIDADARLAPRGRYATRVNVKATLRPPDLAPVKARAKIEGTLDDLALNTKIDAPYNLSLTGNLTDALDQPAVEARLKLSDTRLRAIRKDLPKAGVTATVGAKGPFDDLGIRLDIDADSADYGKAAVSAAARYTPAAVRIDRLALTSPDIAGELSAQGQVALSQGNAMNLTVNWSGLQWPLAGKPQYLSKQGEVRLTGQRTDYRLATDLAWQVVGQTAGKLSVNGRGDMQSFDLAKLELTGGPGHISGQGHIAWAPELAVDARLTGKNINPGAIVADVPGDFDLQAKLRAKRQGDTLTAHIDKLSADGSLRGHPLHLNAKADYAGDHIQVDRFDLESGATTARIAGRFGWTPDAKLDGRWSIDSSDLSKLWPGLAGRLESSGTLAGRVAAPNIAAKLDARGLAYADNTIERAELDARVDWSGQQQSNIDLTIDGVDAAGQAIETVALHGNGTPAAHTISARVDSDIARAAVGLDGHLNKKTQRWRFTLNRLEAAYQKLAPWRLASPASGMLSADAQSLDNACLTSGAARLCLTGAHDAQASSAHIELSDLAYNYAQPFIPDNLEVNGSLSGTVDARLAAGASPEVEAHLTTSAGSLRLTNSNQRMVKVFDMQPGHIDLRMHDSALAAELGLPLAATGRIGAKLQVAPGAAPLTERALDGSVQLEIAKLSVLEKLSSQVDEIRGSLNGDLKLGGTIAQPNILGDLTLNAPRIVLVAPGLVLKGVKLVAVGRGDSIGIQARAQSGGGSLTADGQIALDDTGQDVQLAIRGNDFQIVNIPDVSAYVSPDLTVKVTPSRVDVAGSVTVPKASITPKNLPESGVTTVSGDQVIVTDEEDDAGSAVARAIHADVSVELGDEVSIKGFGLQARLDGDLRVVQQPGEPPSGAGEINIVDGAYRAYNQSLDIQHGRILFAGGPVSQPGLDIRAARYPAEDITVGVQVRGSIGDPKVTLFSDPTMGQSEQLSWLLLGRPLQGATGKQSSLVARAALALGSGRGNKLLKSAGDKVGLDTVSLGAGAGESSDQAALTVGKYLTPKLYISYGIGLFNPVSTLSMRYTLSSHWRLETQSSGAATGGDLIYSIDR